VCLFFVCFFFLKKRMDEGWLITTQTYRSCWGWFHFSLVAGRNAYIREKDVSKNENQEELKN
jgi:hypothetical protein